MRIEMLKSYCILYSRGTKKNVKYSLIKRKDSAAYFAECWICEMKATHHAPMAANQVWSLYKAEEGDKDTQIYHTTTQRIDKKSCTTEFVEFTKSRQQQSN